MELINNKKGMILAGNGSRLNPITLATNKRFYHYITNQLYIAPALTTLKVAEKYKTSPLIKLGKVKRIIKKLLGNGENWGKRINYAIQDKPNGVAEAFLIAEKFIGKEQISLMLGDNLFSGEELSNLLKNSDTIWRFNFCLSCKNPNEYGVVEFDRNFKVKSIIEKPKNPKSKYAITGLYMFDNKVIEYSKKLKPSKRGELEITELHEMYLRNGELNVNILGRATGWFDTGTFDSLHEASSLIKTLEKARAKNGYPEEVAWRNGWIDEEKLRTEAMKFSH